MWIEIEDSTKNLSIAPGSSPLWGCELKSKEWHRIGMDFGVIPFVGMWIEINISATVCAKFPVIPFVGMWIEIKRRKYNENKCIVIPFVGMWIEISKSNCSYTNKNSHPLCGDVNWNTEVDSPEVGSPEVIPFVGMWIEITLENLVLILRKVIPFVGMWIEIAVDSRWDYFHCSHPLCGDVNWNFAWRAV